MGTTVPTASFALLCVFLLCEPSLQVSDTTPAPEMEDHVNPPPSTDTVHTGHETELKTLLCFDQYVSKYCC